ncbi:hypothetical protein [Ferrovum myxofaciens]|uniref:Uncharacterized protein n=1 Tax=Ferrovum myxofaciens TaxID=416213 RepID=A0A9E6MWU9_9PROT|nr:hypothetical protein [Ferrovum myxofaciens]QKE37420.1 MAG: hypothetical protein HO273_00635 [Ferrovum myxofaciens]QWY75068.1 MAG: hypothetical protein JVY19_01060 [Ferrovum myxofaciens]QWY77803.1 MAG: hypothetical protein JZL65_01565 [Ferrovum myxofaciens]
MLYSVKMREKDERFPKHAVNLEADSVKEVFGIAEEMFPGLEMIGATPIFAGRVCQNGNCEE